MAALVVLFGGLILAIRSSDGVLSGGLDRENTDARDAAETGMTRILGELNRPRNRGLLVRAGAESDQPGHLWRNTEATARNPCVLDTPDLTTNPSIGFQEEGPYREVLLDAEGQVIPVATEEERPAALQRAVKAYRLLSVQRQPQLTDAGQPTLRLFQADGRGRVVLAVEGTSIRNGRRLSTVRLEDELQLVPKCCNRPFGGAHGNSLYTADASGRNACLADGWGLVAGAAQDNSGVLTINGLTTIVNDAVPVATVNPLFCIASSPDNCSFNPTSTGFTLFPVPPVLPDVHTNPYLPRTVIGSINRDTVLTDATQLPLLRCTDGGTPSSLKHCPGGRVTVDANATVLPSYCLAGDHESDPAKLEELHCNLAELDYSQLTIEVVNTTRRPLRLYFPMEGNVVRTTGGGTISHDPPTGDATQFSLFGCSDCASQTVKLAGGAGGLDLFAWFPTGIVTVSGGSAYTGVLWANRITSSGGVQWTIPGAAVASALRIAGFSMEDDLNPPLFDWVARSSLAFRWYGE